ncbi:MAG: hypothetical protein KDA61_19030 [Planctomycetales bacterium]|nr:hypothetical protein [Planctomycetales bacterium]
MLARFDEEACYTQHQLKIISNSSYSGENPCRDLRMLGTLAKKRVLSPFWGTVRGVVWAAWATWGAVAAAVIVAYALWRTGNMRPHGAWAVITGAGLGGAVLLLTLALLWGLLRGPRRTAAFAWGLLGMTPLVWIGVYFAELAIRGQTREPLDFNAPLRLAATWIASAMDAEARWRFPRWTPGRYAVLMDDGATLDAERLVAEMDEHFEAMAALLGQPIPDATFPWVRGWLAGQSRRAIGAWALCADDSHPAELTYLDRHEAAHTLITLMCGPDQYPPCLLIEGWAESQSVDRGDMLRQLQRFVESKNVYSLKELIDDWYVTDDGPVYWEGGPFVLYLLERFGGEKFFELYSSVRRASFYADCQRILGEDWETFEKSFWNWHAEALVEAEELADCELASLHPGGRRVEFDESVNLEDWQELERGVLGAADEEWGTTLPKSVAIEASKSSWWIDGDRGEFDATRISTFRGVFDGERFWISHVPDGNRQRYLCCDLGQTAVIDVREDNAPRGWIGAADKAETVRDSALNAWRQFVLPVAQSRWLPIERHPRWDRHFIIHEVQRPSGDRAVWRVDATMVQVNYHAELAPMGWAIEHQVKTVIDPLSNWQITQVQWTGFLEEEQFRQKGEVHVRCYQCEDQWLAKQAETYSSYGPDVEHGSDASSRLLDDEEAAALVEEVKAAIGRGVTPYPSRTDPSQRGAAYAAQRQALMWIAIGVPLVGLLGLALDRRNQRGGEGR